MAPPPNWPISATLETEPIVLDGGANGETAGSSPLRRWRKINCEILIAVSLEWISRNVRGRRRIFLSASKTGWRVYPTGLLRVWKITVTRKINNRPPPYPLEGIFYPEDWPIVASDRGGNNCKILSFNTCVYVWKEEEVNKTWKKI